MRVVARTDLAIIDGNRDGNVRKQGRHGATQAANHSCSAKLAGPSATPESGRSAVSILPLTTTPTSTKTLRHCGDRGVDSNGTRPTRRLLRRHLADAMCSTETAKVPGGHRCSSTRSRQPGSHSATKASTDAPIRQMIPTASLPTTRPTMPSARQSRKVMSWAPSHRTCV
jgi:hypothetical protein